MPTTVPITVLTGYLGAGKTTLLNRILSEDHGKRYAVVVNELGEIGIDGELLTAGAGAGTGGVVEMANGCVCCTVRDDLIRTLHTLLQGDSVFDAIVLETTGVADPAPIAQALLVDDVLQARCTLDSVTTLVDAVHVLRRLEDSPEAVRQIAFADQIVLNKAEMARATELAEIERRIGALNPLAPVHRATRAAVPLEAVLGRGGFRLDRILTLEPALLSSAAAGHVHGADCGHGAHCDHEHQVPGPGHIAAGGLASVSLATSRPMSYDKLSAFVERLLMSQSDDILRAKGIFEIAGDDRRLVIQAVHLLLEGDWQRAWNAGEARSSRLVLIGRNLDKAALTADFAACAA